MNIFGIIPARFESTRFQGKPLVMIHGKTMIQRVFERCLQSKLLTDLYVATDDERIALHVLKFGGKVIMTSSDITSGTQRCQVASALLSGQGCKIDGVINIQGDEPFIKHQLIDDVAKSLMNKTSEIVTACKLIEVPDEIMNPNVVKVVFDETMKAMYFSRSAIPFIRGTDSQDWIKVGIFYKHIGIYAYRYKLLQKIVSLPLSYYENAESLEQLRWLYHGVKINTIITEYDSIGIDTPGDLKRIKAMFS